MIEEIRMTRLSRGLGKWAFSRSTHARIANLPNSLKSIFKRSKVHDDLFIPYYLLSSHLGDIV